MNESPQFSDSYYEIVVFVSESLGEVLGSFVVDNFAQGLFWDDDSRPGLIGIGFYVSPDNLENVLDRVKLYIKSIEPDFKIAKDDIVVKLINVEDWQEKYRQSVRPVAIGEFYVRPPWEKSNPNHPLNIIIEPRMAFGTGSHESTIMCLQAIDKYVDDGMSFFDLGCGSGILSIAAALKGATPVMGVDIDDASVENARENVALNDLNGRIKIEQGSIEKSGLDGRYDFVAANMIKSILTDLLPGIFKAVKDDGMIVFAGLLMEEESEFMQLLSTYKCRKIDNECDGQWLSLVVFK